jgi:dTDP-4-amino-4,6-dideoxygalactose transaminase
MKTLSWDKYRGHLSSYDIDELGYNYRTTEVQSALGLVQLGKMGRNNQKREKLVETYRKELQETKGLSLPFSQWGGRPSYHLFSILTAPSVKREKVMEGLRRHGIQTSIHYPPIHLFSLYRKNFGYREGMLPRTEEVSQRVITLPLHPLMNVRDVKWIAEKVKRVIKEVS